MTYWLFPATHTLMVRHNISLSAQKSQFKYDQLNRPSSTWTTQKWCSGQLLAAIMCQSLRFIAIRRTNKFDSVKRWFWTHEMHIKSNIRGIQIRHLPMASSPAESARDDRQFFPRCVKKLFREFLGIKLYEYQCTAMITIRWVVYCEHFMGW